MNIWLEFFMTLGLFFYYILEAIVLFFCSLVLPAKMRSKDIKGQRVLITGAGSGIGRLMAHRFGKLGCILVLVDINKEGNEQTASEVREYGVLVHTYTCDLSQREEVYHVTDKVKTDVGDIDILVNNAGIVSGYKILKCPDALMEKTMAVNAMAHFWTVKAFLPAMLKRNRGHIVTVASGAGLSGVNGLVDYCASKFAAVGFDESLRCELSELKRNGVKTTVVCPYYINTGMFEGAKSRFPSIIPFLEPDYAADKIIEAVLTNQEILCLPRLLYIVFAMKNILPVKAAAVLNDFMGINHSMDQFRGRAAKND